MDESHLPTLITEVISIAVGACHTARQREKGGQFMPNEKFLMPFMGGFLGVIVLGAAAFGLVAGSANQGTGAPVSDLAPLTPGNASPVAAGPRTVNAKPPIPPVTAPSAAPVLPTSSAAL